MTDEDYDIEVFVSESSSFKLKNEEYNRSVRIKDGKTQISINDEFLVIDRVGGPAVVHLDGPLYWFSEGYLHRADGPAVESDLKKEWWVNGKRHKTDGPAVTYRFGLEEWWQDGKLHRETGPAITTRNGKELEYWLDDKAVRYEEWFCRVHGALAVSYYDARSRTYKIHFFKGVEDYKDAWRDVNGCFYVHIDGENHVIERLDGPAIFWPDGTKEWLTEGLAHREGGPAIEYPDNSGWETWYMLGEVHREDGPAETAIIRDNGEEITYKRWYKAGQLHRDDGPAELVINEDGTVIDASYYVNGKLVKTESEMAMTDEISSQEALDSDMIVIHVVDLNGEPTRIACNIDAFEKDVFQEEDQWYLNGHSYKNVGGSSLDGELLIHRDEENPAIIYPDGHQEWLIEGRLSREGGPAVIHSDGSSEWWEDGLLHREDGPAKISSDGDHEYWIAGRNIAKETFEEYVGNDEDKEGPEMIENITLDSVVEETHPDTVPEEVASIPEEAATMPKEPVESAGEKVTVKVKIKSGNIHGDPVQQLFFFDEAEYVKCCYRDEQNNYKIKLSTFVDALVHCDDGPAVEYSDGRTAFCINGKVVDSKQVGEAAVEKSKESSQLVIRDEDREPVYVQKQEELYSNYLIHDGPDARVRWRDTGAVLSNRFESAILHRDGTEAHIISGKTVKGSHMQVPSGHGYEVELVGKWTYGDLVLNPTKLRAFLKTDGEKGPYWSIDVFFEDTDFVYFSELFFDDMNDGFIDLHNVVLETDLDHLTAFSTYEFIHKFLCSVAAFGPKIITNTPVITEENREAYEIAWNLPLEHLYTEPEPVCEEEPAEADDGFGLPLACLAIAGLAGIATNKAKKSKAIKSQAKAVKINKAKEVHVEA